MTREIDRVAAANVPSTEPAHIARLRHRMRPGALLSAAKKGAIRREIAEWEAAQTEGQES
jgi:hypothetical protein